MSRLVTLQAPAWQEPTPTEKLTFNIKVITPLFGGGYEARNVDPVTIIRPATIRGHLRFWWRATVGAQYATAQELYRAEAAIWGGAADKDNPNIGAGKVTIKVQLQCCGQDNRNQEDWPGYALYPFQGKATRDAIEEQPYARTGVSFVLSLTCSDEIFIEEVRSSVLAWILYGGIGARTRRGCGSLALTVFQEIGSTIPDKKLSLSTSLFGAEYVLGQETNDPLNAWNTAVSVYKDFRQRVSFARNPGANPLLPGRSKWPEADSIRRITGRNNSNHVPNHQVQCGFPRANLGLPIIFHFKDKGDPFDTTLQGTKDGFSRFASPVITKAIQVGANTYKPLVFVLNSPNVWEMGDLRLKEDNGAPCTISEQNVELSQGERSQVFPLNPGAYPVRSALLNYVNRQWQGSKRGRLGS